MFFLRAEIFILVNTSTSLASVSVPADDVQDPYEATSISRGSQNPLVPAIGSAEISLLDFFSNRLQIDIGKLLEEILWFCREGQSLLARSRGYDAPAAADMLVCVIKVMSEY